MSRLCWTPNIFFAPVSSFVERFMSGVAALYRNLSITGDWEMWVRAVHFGGGIVHPQPLASWRRSAGHETGRFARSGEIYQRLSSA